MSRPLRGFVCVCLAVLGVFGCSDLGAPLRLFPRAELSVSTLDFGTVAVGAAATRSVTIGNSGEADLHGVAAVSCSEFTVESGGGAFTVRPGDTHVVVMRYAPSAVAPSSCELTLGDGLPPVVLSGAGSPTPVSLCVASVSAIDFGLVAVGGSKFGVFRLYSRGTAAVDVNVAAPCGQFTLVGGGGARTVAPGDSVVVTLLFAPSAGGHVVCTLSTGPGCPDVALSGEATSVSFQGDVQPILSSHSCVACHGWSSPSQLVDVPAAAYAADLVKPFDLAGSVLYGKVSNTRQYGGVMPPVGITPVSAAERTKIATWILEGAHDN